MDFKWFKMSVATPACTVSNFDQNSVMQNIYLLIISILTITIAVLLIFWNESFLVKDTNVQVDFAPVENADQKENGVEEKDSPRVMKDGNRKVKCHIPKFMLELYENNKESFNITSPDIVRSVVPKHSDSLNTSELLEDFSESHLLIFDLPKTNNDEIFVYAELKVLTLVELKRESPRGIDRKVTLSTYDPSQNKFIEIHQLHMYHRNDTWLSFVVTEQVAQILDNNGNDFKILITVSSQLSIDLVTLNKLKFSLLPPNENMFEHDYPILLLSYISNTTHPDDALGGNFGRRIQTRTKRFIENDYGEEETNNVWDELLFEKTFEKKMKRIKNSCRRKPLYVDFAEINYDEWIVQPRGYEAFQCQGKCSYPVAEHLNPTKHAIVQALLHSVAPLRAPRSCCVPTRLDSISILYVDNYGVLTYRYAYRDMVVLECGCR